MKNKILSFEITVRNQNRQWRESYVYNMERIYGWLGFFNVSHNDKAFNLAERLGKEFVSYFNRTLREGELPREFVCVNSAVFV